MKHAKKIQEEKNEKVQHDRQQPSLKVDIKENEEIGVLIDIVLQIDT